jgi:hypothetical protein
VAKQGFNGEILHFNAIRLRVTGSGNLQLTMKSLDDVNTLALANTVMAATTNIEPTTLTNFIDQRGCLEGTTTLINETFNISKIVIFIRPIASGYPG